ncbi:DnaT-like ssDNA-binding protein [Bosea sp. AS-1]|uniref:DnaT-like ssDNA-binding protein n=1 Tax=Bosea sp. AS-1 TaxID=2015316 RepID=UPI000B787E17|nr:DnaT-like ssDNA-binding protein [Bosea sp. AS-1]
MTLIVEDGTAKTDANAYVSVADADAYFATNTAWTALNVAQKEAAIIAATQWVDDAYFGLWNGYRYSQGQARAWPRDMSPGLSLYTMRGFAPRVTVILYDYDGFPIWADQVPKAVQRACMEAALLSATGFDFIKNGNTAAITSTSRTVDRVSYTNSYAAPVSQRHDKLKAIDRLLLGLVKNAPGATAGNVRIQRA